MPFYPGPGIGGHCIPCDPVFLSWKAKKLGFKTKMVDLALEMNRFMPKYVVQRVAELLEQNNSDITKSNILLLGVTYKKDVKDLRESPALEIIEGLAAKKARIAFSDPLIPYIKLDHIDLKGVIMTKENIRKYDCIILVTDHANVDYDFIRLHARMIFDTRNVYKGNFPNIVKL
jgi:UDP-N-acetyl-D-glucosamine dehydrogenase